MGGLQSFIPVTSKVKSNTSVVYEHENICIAWKRALSVLGMVLASRLSPKM